MIGAIVSRTSTEKVAVPTFAAASLARQVATVVPIAKIEPLAGLHETDVTPTASVASGSAKATTAPAAPVASATMSEGLVTRGAVTSLTTTLNLVVEVLPAASDAVHVTWVDPTGNWEPLGGAQTTEVTPTSSVACGS